jgi:hypothetical protein
MRISAEIFAFGDMDGYVQSIRRRFIVIATLPAKPRRNNRRPAGRR